jgi:DNA-binding transcriptional MerR regulator
VGETELKVGELADRTGLSVRTLHHYDEIGLLAPSRRTAAGHRLYALAQVTRLQQIQSLRSLGFSLDEIRDCLARPGWSAERVVRLHLEALDRQIEHQQRLRQRLEWLRDHLDRSEAVSLEDLIQTVEATTMLVKYYSPEQLEQLADRRKEVGEEKIREVQTCWGDLIPRVQEALDRGATSDDPDVAQLAREWRDLTRETVAGFTGGDAGIGASLGRMWKEEPGAWTRFGMSPEVVGFIVDAVRRLDDG